MKKKLPIVVVGGDRYILDEAANELRHVDKPSRKISLDDAGEICIEMDDEFDALFIEEAFADYDIYADGNLLCLDPSILSALESEIENKESLFSGLKKKLFG